VTALGNVGTNWKIAGIGDFNGDGHADILWRDGAGNGAMWEMNGHAVQLVAGLGNVGTAAWKIQGTGDFNGDGNADILFQNTNGTPVIWTMNGPNVTSVTSLANPGQNWHAITT